MVNKDVYTEAISDVGSDEIRFTHRPIMCTTCHCRLYLTNHLNFEISAVYNYNVPSCYYTDAHGPMR